MCTDRFQCIYCCVIGFFICGRWRYNLAAFAVPITTVLLGLVTEEKTLLFQVSLILQSLQLQLYNLSARGLVPLEQLIVPFIVVPQVKNSALQVSSLSGYAAILTASLKNVGAPALLIPAIIGAAIKQSVYHSCY